MIRKKKKRNSKWKIASLAFSSLRERTLKEIFDKCDAGCQDQQISKNKLIRAIKRDEAIAEFFHLPKKFKKEDEIKALREFTQRVDRNGDGLLTWDEFLNFDRKSEHDRHVADRALRRMTVDSTKATSESDTLAEKDSGNNRRTI